MRLEAQALAKTASPSAQPPPVQFLLDLQQQFRRRRRYELFSCVVGLLGIALMLMENEIVQRNDNISAKSELLVLVLKSFVSASTVLLATLLVLRYRCDGRVNQLQSAVPSKSARFSLWRPLLLLLELFVCSFHIPPGVVGQFEIVQLHGAPSAEDNSICEPLGRGTTGVRHGNSCYLVYQYPVEVLGVFMAARLYLLARFVRSSSALHSPWISLVGSLNGVDAMKPFFHFKAIFKLHPLNVLLPLTVLNTLLTAAIVRVLERPIQAAFDNYWKSVWFTVVTLSGTGLGDYFPVTYLGRAFSVMGGMFCGVLIVALIQSLFFNFLDLSPSEKQVRYLIELGWWEKETRQNAAKLLQAAWRSGNLQRGTDVGDQRHLFSTMRMARSLRMKKPSIELSLEDQIAEMEATVLAEVERMAAQKVKILGRIQAKAARLAALKQELSDQWSVVTASAISSQEARHQPPAKPRRLLPRSTSSPPGPSRLGPMASDWLFSASELQRSPSRRDGVSLASELERRSEACRLIARLAAALHVSLATQRAACVFLHRFFMRRSLDTSDERYVAAACLLLAAKAEDHETQGVDACRLAKALTTSEVVSSEVAGKLLQLEGDVLLALAFELEVDHSFCYIAAEVDKVVSLPHMGDSLQFTLKQTAWSFLNDSAITWTCLAVDAPLAAKAAVYAAGLFQGCVAEDTVTELGAPWWTVLETPVDVLKDAARHVLSAYTAPFVDTGALPRALVELVAIFHSDKTEANEPSEICVRGPVLPEPMTSEPQDDDFKPVEMDAEVLFPIVDGSPSIDAAFVEQTTAWIDDCVVIVKGQGKGEQSPSSPSDPCDVEKSIPLYSPMENCTQAPVIRKRTISFADNGRSLKKAKFAL